MANVFVNIGWASIFIVITAIVGIILILASTLVVTKLLEKFTPKIDEEREIARGNVAVAQYFGRISAACIIGVSIIIAAAILGGIIFAIS
jgi:NhaP-type Na+/H+ or K+/H+ antiporter